MPKFIATALLMLLSFLLVACQVDTTPTVDRLPPYVTPDGPNTLAGVPLYPDSVELQGQRARFANRLLVTYGAKGEPSSVTAKLKNLLIEYNFGEVKSDEPSKNQFVLVGRKTNIVAVLTITPNGTGQSVINYSLVLRNPSGS